MTSINRITVLCGLALSALLPAKHTWAQEVTPELSLGMESVGSAGAEFSGGSGSTGSATGIVDFSDTALLLRARTQLYPDIRGGSAIGLQFPDADSELGAVFFHKAYLYLEGQHFDLKVGRSKLQSSVIGFPTLRDDDMLAFTDALNPMASGTTTEDHQFGNVLEVTGILGAKYFGSLHAEHLFLTPGDKNAEDFTLNSVGTNLTYRNIPARIDTELVREAGIAVNYYDAKDDGLEGIWNLVAGAALNLRADPIHLVDVRAQAIYNGGDGDKPLTDANSTFRAQALRGALSVRYLYSKSTIPTMQFALTGGYAHYLSDSATAWSGVANSFYSLGAEFDVGWQYQLTMDSSALRQALGTAQFSHSVQAVLRFGFEMISNPLPKRDSILNVEHKYIP